MPLLLRDFLLHEGAGQPRETRELHEGTFYQELCRSEAGTQHEGVKPLAVNWTELSRSAFPSGVEASKLGILTV